MLEHFSIVTVFCLLAMSDAECCFALSDRLCAMFATWMGFSKFVCRGDGANQLFKVPNNIETMPGLFELVLYEVLPNCTTIDLLECERQFLDKTDDTKSNCRVLQP